MTCSASAADAVIGSLSTSTPNSGSAPVTVESVERLESIHPVYNLTVDGESEYFASGVLVHNCDALRYLVVSGLDLAKTKSYSDTAPSIPEQTFGLY